MGWNDWVTDIEEYNNEFGDTARDHDDESGDPDLIDDPDSGLMEEWLRDWERLSWSDNGNE